MSCDLELPMITASGRKQRNPRAYFEKKIFFFTKPKLLASFKVNMIENKNNPLYIVSIKMLGEQVK